MAGGTKVDRGDSERQRAIFITGAASGIGRATAELFASRGWFVGGFDVNRNALAALSEKLGPGAGLFRPLDVTDRAAVLAAVEEFGRATGGKLDLLFNNAGIDAKGPFAEMSWEKIVAVVNVNLLAGMSLIHAAISLLRATPNSLCFSTSSASAIFGTAGLAVYSATKHAVKGLTEALSVELAAHGVRAADVLPGIIETGMLPAESKAIFPKQGMWRVMPASAVAETVFAAYESKKLHWYVPEELADYDVQITREPEATRDGRLAGGLF
jgi:NAD(P)-dependent dehydrogenase (short-subunit alcohol dehydrogenase family)